MKTKLLAVGSTLLLVAGLFSMGTMSASADTPAAHTQNASATCSTLSVNLADYVASEVNTVSVTIDSVVVDSNSNFGTTFTKSYQFTDKTIAHTWKVKFIAGDDLSGGKGWTGKLIGTTTPCVANDVPAVVPSAPKYEIALYVYPLVDSSKPASWENSGTQTLVAHRPASSTSDWYTTFPGNLPGYVCGSGWGVQQDIAMLSSTFSSSSFPNTVDRAAGTGILGWPPIVAANHQSVLSLVSYMPSCDTSVSTVPVVTFTDQCGTANDSIVGATSTAMIVYTVTDSRDSNGVGDVTVTAAPVPGYVFAKDAYTGPWSHTFTNTPCLTTITPVKPNVTANDKCGTAFDTLTVDSSMVGVVYTVTWNDAHTVATVTATNADTSKYAFAKDATTSWQFTFTNEACPTIQPLAPSAFDPLCTTEGDQGGQPNVAPGSMGYIELDLKPHLHYTIDGQPTTSAQNYLAPGTYKVAVTVDTGYDLVGPSSWEMTINPPFCPPTFALHSTTATMANNTCSIEGSYTLADTEGVAWFVNGATIPTPAGTYRVAGATTVNVEAKLIDPVKDGWEQDAQTAWTFTFTDPTDCLPTLAFTGSTGNPIGLPLGLGLLLFGGGAIAFERKFRFNAK